MEKEKDRINSSIRLLNKFLETEAKLNLLDKNDENYLWEWAAHRKYIYLKIATKKNVFQKAHDDSNDINSLNKIFKVLKYLFNNPFISWKRKEIIILPHKRKMNFNGKKVDLNSKYIEEDLRKKNKKLEIWDLPHNNDHQINGRDIYYLDLISTIGRLGNVVGKYFFTEKNKMIYSLIEKELNINLSSYLLRLVLQFKVKKQLFKMLLKIKRAEKIYIVTSYGHTALIKAAKELGIKVIELQHGVIDEFHVGYHYPTTKSSDYFPDELWVWDSMWKQSASFPIKDSNVIINKNNHLESFKKRCSRVKEKKSILVISQGTIGQELSNHILRRFESLKGYKIYYKLHPGEFGSSNGYTSLSKLEKKDNVEVIRGEKTVYDLFELVGNVVGVYSTALYEAHYFNKSIFIVPISGFEYMKRFLEEDNVEYFKSLQSL